MNIVLWVLAGVGAGWVAYAVIGFNEERGLAVSLAIGAFGGFIGGNVLAPMLVSTAAAQTGVSAPALFIAFGVAAAFLFLGNLVHKRWGI